MVRSEPQKTPGPHHTRGRVRPGTPSLAFRGSLKSFSPERDRPELPRLLGGGTAPDSGCGAGASAAQSMPEEAGYVVE